MILFMLTYFAFFALFSGFRSFQLPDREVKFKLARIGCLEGERQVLTLPEARVKTFQFVFDTGRLPITRLAARFRKPQRQKL